MRGRAGSESWSLLQLLNPTQHLLYDRTVWHAPRCKHDFCLLRGQLGKLRGAVFFLPPRFGFWCWLARTGCIFLHCRFSVPNNNPCGLLTNIGHAFVRFSEQASKEIKKLLLV